MIGQIRKSAAYAKVGPNNHERELKAARDILDYWRDNRYGVDEFPASAGVRLALGQQIAGLKRTLVESGKYEIVQADGRRRNS